MAGLPVIYPGGFALPTGLPIHPDATVREEHGVTYTVTSVPIELGAQLTNHVQPEPVPLVVDIVLAQKLTFPDLNAPPSFSRAKGLYEQILALLATREPFDYWTTLRAYPSMIGTSLSTPRTAESGDALVVTLVMRRIEIALVDALQVASDAALAMTLGAQQVGSVSPTSDGAVDGVGAVA